MLYTGIDLHKRTVVIATIDETGKVHSEVSLPTSRGVNPKWCLIAASMRPHLDTSDPPRTLNNKSDGLRPPL